MKDDRILMDSFVVPRGRMRIYRVRYRGTATMLWASRKAALQYAKELHLKKLQAQSKGG